MKAVRMLKRLVLVLVVVVGLSSCSGCGDVPTQPSCNAAPSSEYVDGWKAADRWFAKWGEPATDGQIAGFLVKFEIPTRRVEWHETEEYHWEEVISDPIPYDELAQMKAVDVCFRTAPDWDAMSEFQLGAMARMRMRNPDVELAEVTPVEEDE